MKVCKNCNLDFDNNERFCYQCGQKLFLITENKIDNFAQDVSVITSSIDKNIKSFQTEFQNSETAKKIKKESRKLGEVILVLFGLIGLVILLANLFTVIYNKENTFLYELLNSNSESIYYSADFTTKFQHLTPSLILPTFLTIIASFKKPIFLLGPIICFIIVRIVIN